MNWSFKIGRMLVLGFIAIAHWLAHGSLGAVIGGVGFFVALFVCVLLHE